MPETRPLLSLSLIMRDAEQDIEACLRSCAEAVDEMIVCDTGSTDGSVEIAERFLRDWQAASPGRRGELCHFQWCDDFAAAKNFALDKVRGQWVLLLDSDERFTEETQANLRPLVEELAAMPEPYDEADIWRHNVDMEGQDVEEEDDRTARLARVDSALRFRGEVHEMLVWEDGHPKRTFLCPRERLLLLHTGYRPGEHEKHTARNDRILQKEEQQGGNTLLLNRYLAHMYLKRGDYGTAARYAEAMLTGVRVAYDEFEPWRLLYRCMEGQLDEAASEAAKKEAGERLRAVLENGIRDCPDYPDFYYRRGLLRKQEGRLGEARVDLERALLLQGAFGARHPNQEDVFAKELPALGEALAALGEGQKAAAPAPANAPAPPAVVQSAEEEPAWRFCIARGESLGGRACRQMLTRKRQFYRLWEEASSGGLLEEPWPDGARGPLGLFLPLIGPVSPEEPWGGVARLAAARQLLEEARGRGAARAVLLLSEPEPAIFRLCEELSGEDFSCAAVCACRGELFGATRQEDPRGLADELLSLCLKAARQGRKSLSLPCPEQEVCRLTYAEDLAEAAAFVLWQDKGTRPLSVAGGGVHYGDLAREMARAAGYPGQLRFGRKSWPKPGAATGLRQMVSRARLQLSLVLDCLVRNRARGGHLRLSACVIMRDNEAEIGRCLASLAAADELIVVDTGSRDSSVEIARQYTDKIYHFPWQDDFAAARNYALDRISGDCFVFLDSDEFFTEETAPGLKRLCEDYSFPARLDALSLQMRNVGADLQPLPSLPTDSILRIARRGLRYEGAVHESLTGEEKKQKNFVMSVPPERALLLHTGYSPERLEAKHERNWQLLEREWAAGREVALGDYYRAREAYRRRRWTEAAAAARAAVDTDNLPVNECFEIYRWWDAACRELGDEAGRRSAWAAMRRDMPEMPEAWSLEGKCLWEQGRRQEALPALLCALELEQQVAARRPMERDDFAGEAPAWAAALAEYCGEQGAEALGAYARSLDPGKKE